MYFTVFGRNDWFVLMSKYLPKVDQQQSMAEFRSVIHYYWCNLCIFHKSVRVRYPFDEVNITRWQCLKWTWIVFYVVSKLFSFKPTILQADRVYSISFIIIDSSIQFVINPNLIECVQQTQCTSFKLVPKLAVRRLADKRPPKQRLKAYLYRDYFIYLVLDGRHL